MRLDEAIGHPPLGNLRPGHVEGIAELPRDLQDRRDVAVGEDRALVESPRGRDDPERLAAVLLQDERRAIHAGDRADRLGDRFVQGGGIVDRAHQRDHPAEHPEPRRVVVDLLHREGRAALDVLAELLDQARHRLALAHERGGAHEVLAREGLVSLLEAHLSDLGGDGGGDRFAAEEGELEARALEELAPVRPFSPGEMNPPLEEVEEGRLEAGADPPVDLARLVEQIGRLGDVPLAQTQLAEPAEDDGLLADRLRLPADVEIGEVVVARLFEVPLVEAHLSHRPAGLGEELLVARVAGEPDGRAAVLLRLVEPFHVEVGEGDVEVGGGKPVQVVVAPLDLHALAEALDGELHIAERPVDEAEVVVARRHSHVVVHLVAQGEAAVVALDGLLVLAAVPVDGAHQVVGLRHLARMLLLLEELEHEQAVLPRPVEMAEPVVDPREIVVELRPLVGEDMVALRLERMLEELLGLEELPLLLQDLAFAAHRLDGEGAEIPRVGRFLGLSPAVPVELLGRVHSPDEGEVLPDLQPELESQLRGKVAVEALARVGLVEVVHRAEPLAPEELLEELVAVERRLAETAAAGQVEVAVDDGRRAGLAQKEGDLLVQLRSAILGDEAEHLAGEEPSRRSVDEAEVAAGHVRELGAGLDEAEGDEVVEGAVHAVPVRLVDLAKHGQGDLEGEDAEKGEDRALFVGESGEERGRGGFVYSPSRRTGAGDRRAHGDGNVVSEPVEDAGLAIGRREVGEDPVRRFGRGRRHPDLVDGDLAPLGEVAQRVGKQRVFLVARDEQQEIESLDAAGDPFDEPGAEQGIAVAVLDDDRVVSVGNLGLLDVPEEHLVAGAPDPRETAF